MKKHKSLSKKLNLSSALLAGTICAFSTTSYGQTTSRDWSYQDFPEQGVCAAWTETDSNKFEIKVPKSDTGAAILSIVVKNPPITNPDANDENSDTETAQAETFQVSKMLPAVEILYKSRVKNPVFVKSISEDENSATFVGFPTDYKYLISRVIRENYLTLYYQWQDASGKKTRDSFRISLRGSTATVRNMMKKCVGRKNFYDEDQLFTSKQAKIVRAIDKGDVDSSVEISKSGIDQENHLKALFAKYNQVLEQQEKKSGLNQQLSQTNSTIRRLVDNIAEIDSLRSERQSLPGRISNQESLVRSLQNKVSQLESIKDSAYSKYIVVKRRVDQLSSEVSSARSTMQDYGNRVSSTRSAIDSNRSSTRNARSENQSMRSSIQSLQSDVSNWDRQAQPLRTELSRKNEIRQEIASRYKTERQQLRQTANQLENKISRQEQAPPKLRQLSTLLKRGSQQISRFANAQKRLETELQKDPKDQAQIKAIRARLQTIRSNFSSTQSAVGQIQLAKPIRPVTNFTSCKIKGCANIANNAKSAVSTRLSNVTNNLNNMRNELRSTRNRLTQIKNSIDSEYDRKIGDISRKLSNLESRISTAKSQISGYRSRIESNRNRIQRNENELPRLQANLNTYVSQRDQAENRWRQKQNELANYKSSSNYDGLRNAYSRAYSNWDQARGSLSSASSTLSQLRQRNNYVTSRLAQVERHYETYKSQLASQRQQQSNLQQQINVVEGVIAKHFNAFSSMAKVSNGFLIKARELEIY